MLDGGGGAVSAASLHVTPEGRLLAACPHYETAKPGTEAAANMAAGDFRTDTCMGCGGDGWHGPSCICPAFGEGDDS
jgi:hypothetical protein